MVSLVLKLASFGRKFANHTEPQVPSSLAVPCLLSARARQLLFYPMTGRISTQARQSCALAEQGGRWAPVYDSEVAAQNLVNAWGYGGEMYI